MSNGDYKRLCTVIGCCEDVLIKKRGLCKKHYARFHAHGYAEKHKIECKQCKTVFETEKQVMYCSAECRYRFNNGCEPMADRLAKLEQARKNKEKACDYCGVMYFKRASGEQRKKGEPSRFCSRECGFDNTRRLTREVAALRRIRDNNQPSAEKSKRYMMAIARLKNALRSVGIVKNRSRLCELCGKPFERRKQSKSLCCSDGCTKKRAKSLPKTEHTKDMLKAYKARREALKRGASHGKSFKPRDVFERDGWTCQMCGVQTPQDLRGKNKPRSPELDHIHPISKGGAHTVENCQTLCRACNAWKSDKIIPAQKGLFTNLVQQ